MFIFSVILSLVYVSILFNDSICIVKGTCIMQ